MFIVYRLRDPEIPLSYNNNPHDHHPTNSPATSLASHGTRAPGSGADSSDGDANDTEYRDGSSGKSRKRHICRDCGKGFSRPSHLCIHENTHTGAKPFCCPFPSCGHAFNVRSNMRRHIPTHYKTPRPRGRSSRSSASKSYIAVPSSTISHAEERSFSIPHASPYTEPQPTQPQPFPHSQTQVYPGPLVFNAQPQVQSQSQPPGELEDGHAFHPYPRTYANSYETPHTSTYPYPAFVYASIATNAAYTYAAQPDEEKEAYVCPPQLKRDDCERTWDLNSGDGGGCDDELCHTQKRGPNVYSESVRTRARS
ncbi:hypothetical protein DFH06DRAFT_1174890 [Mycena polygramma]|nr:hypothetical protein DFH06DRAFT_1174890 [Mycena polygramma]